MVGVEGTPLEQVTKQLNKLVNVLKIVELEESQAVQRELLLVKVRADERDPRAACSRPSSCSTPRSSTSARRRSPSRSRGRRRSSTRMLKMLEPYGIREMVQSGMVALGRGPRSMTQARACAAVDRSA